MDGCGHETVGRINVSLKASFLATFLAYHATKELSSAEINNKPHQKCGFIGFLKEDTN